MIIIDVKDDKVRLNLQKLSSALKKGVEKALLDVGYELLRLSQEQVPHDTGSLQNSGNVEVIGGDVVVGYHKPYAARLHEHPEYRFQRGRKGKYLEDPLRDNKKVFDEHIGRDLDATIRTTL